MSGKFRDHFVITDVTRNSVLGVVTVSVRFDTGPKIYAFDIDYDNHVYDKELIGQEIQSQMG